MNALVTLPNDGATIDLSAIVAIGPIFENYKYTTPYLFNVKFVTRNGASDCLVGNDSKEETSEDYYFLMKAWQDYKSSSKPEPADQQVLSVEEVLAIVKSNSLRIFFRWPVYTEGPEPPVPTGIQVSFHEVVAPSVWEHLMTTPCQVPLTTRGYRDCESSHIRPEYSEAVISVNEKRKKLGLDLVSLVEDDPINNYV